MGIENLNIEEHSYPNPDYKYGEFSIDGRNIGRAEKHQNGWILRGSRKVRSENDIVFILLDRMIRDARNRKIEATLDEQWAMEALLEAKINTSSRTTNLP